MPNIQDELKALKVDEKVKKNIQALENFFKKNNSTRLSDLIAPTFNSTRELASIKKLLESSNILATIANGTFNKDSDQLLTDIKTKIKEIRDNYPSLREVNSLGRLDAVKNSLEKEIKKPPNERNESVISKAENELKLQTKLVLKEQLKNAKGNFKLAIELYNLTSNYPLCIARYFWLKEQCKQNLNYAETIENLIRERIITQATADITGSSHLVSGNITLLDLVKIKNWNSFKLDFGKQLNVLLTKKNEAAALTNKTSDTLTEKNSNLLKEVNELKEKITTLETELSIARSNLEENKTLTSNEPEDSSFEEFNSSKEQNDKKITDLNKQLLDVNAKNEQLITEIVSNKELNIKQQQNISNLSDELAILKTELDAKEKQVAENTTELKQREDQLNQKEKELSKNKSALEKSSHEIQKLSENLTNLSKKLDEKNQTLNQKESELNVLSNEKRKIELQMQQLNDALHEKKYNDGLIEQKEQETIQLREQLKQLKEQFKQEKDNLTSNSHAHDYKISRLESDINEKELSLEQLKNELDISKKIVNQHKHQINILKTNLESKEQELNQSKLQLQTLTEQSEHLSDQKNTLEQKYKTELADSLARYKALQSQLSLTTEDFGEKLNSLLEKNTSYEKENQKLKGNLEFFKMNLEEEKASLLKAENEISALTNNLSSIQSDLASTNQNFHAQLETTKAEKESLVKEYDLFISEVDKILYATKNHVSSFAQLDYLSEEHNQILKKLHTLKGKIDKNEDLEDENSHLKNQISELEFNSVELKSETIKRLTHEKQILEEKIWTLETELMKAQQDKYDQHSLTNRSLNFDFEDDDFLRESLMDDNADDYENEDETFDYQSLAATQILLKNAQTELAQKTDELEQLHNQLLVKESEVENLKTKTQEETDDLASRLTEAQEKLNASGSEIANLKKSSEETKTNLSQRINEKEALIQKFEEQIHSQTLEFERLQNSLTKELSNKQEELNKLLDEQKGKSKHIEQLKDELKQNEHNLSVSHKNFDDLEKKLLITKETLSKIKIDLEQAKKALTQSQDASDELSNERNKLKKAIEDFQKNDSDLQKKYDTLTEASQEKSVQIDTLTNKIKDIQSKLEISQQEATELNQKIKALETIKEDLEQKLRTDNITTLGGGMPTNTEVDLIDLGSGSIPNEELIKSKINLSKTDSSSSGNFSGQSSSHTSSENLNVFPDADDVNEPIIKNVSRSSQDLLNDSDGEDELQNSTLTQPLNPSPSKPTSEQLETLEEVKQGVNAAFKQENHPAIIEAFTKEFFRSASHAAHTSFNGEYVDALPDFEEKLQEISENEIKGLVSALLNNTSLQSCIYEKIQVQGLGQLTYLEEVKHSASLVFNNLTIKQPNKNDQKYQDYIYDKANNLLIKLCIENLQINEKEGLFELAKNSLENQVTANGLQTIEHTAIIQKAATELVTKLFETSHLQNTLKELIKNLTPGLNLLVASTQKLHDQLKEQVNHNFDHYFPSLHLDPILEKINNGKALSDEEIAKLPSELQYADTIEEFVAGLRVAHPNLPPHYENQLNEDTFKQLRLILRNTALHDLALDFEANEIMNLNAEKWLEKKVQLVTKKSSSLKLDKKQQKYLDKKFQKLFMLSPLETLAITHKSADELKKELKKLHDLKLDATVRLSKTFAEIEPKLSEYPNLITKDGTFQANLNNSLPLNSPNLSDVQLQILLAKINFYLENDITKWNLLNNNKIAQEIAADIISDPTNPFDPEIDIQTLVSNSLAILYKFHNLQDTLNKRKQWHTEIQQLYALTQKLKASSQFNQEIEDRVNKLEDMLGLKENDADENLNAFPKGVYLPHKCRLISNSQLDSSDTEEYHLQVGDFYKQEALKVGKTVTFAQKLSDEGECKWSATLNNEKCLSFKTQKKFFRREKSYLQEVSFAQMIYSVNSFKNAKTCTLNFGNCSQNIKEQLYLFAKAYNELRLEDNELQKRPKINCNIKNPPDLDKAKIAAVKEEIKAQLSLRANELEDIASKLKDDDTMRHQIIRSRG